MIVTKIIRIELLEQWKSRMSQWLPPTGVFDFGFFLCFLLRIGTTELNL